MKTQAFDIPDDASQTADWLARKLVGMNLADLIAELRAIHQIPMEQKGHGAEIAASRLTNLLGDQRKDFLANGFSTLSSKMIGRLLVEPELLSALQELVLTEGGAYWQQLAEEDPAFDDRLPMHNPRLASADGQGSSPEPPMVSTVQRPWHASRALWVLATAASVMLSIFAYDRFQRGVAVGLEGWGWERADALAQNSPPDKYLNQLADSANEWFQDRPADPSALAKRISEFRQGCTRVLLSEHTSLSPEDRVWLKERCRVWATKFDDYLTEIESGRDDSQVQVQMDATVHKLVDSLRARARTDASG